MRKYVPTKNELEKILVMYNEELFGSQRISEETGLSRHLVIRILKENGVILGPSGRRFIGGKKVSDKKYREKNKEKLSEKHKEWYDKNKDKWFDYIKEYREKNIDRIREVKRTYEKTRKANDPIYKLISNFRTAICQVLKENNVEKNGYYFEILKYSPDELISHLEKQFKDDMSWDNYGKWHVDHIKPISSFNINEIGDKEFMECWNLNNLQPLWGEENIRKSNKII
jgi:predicted transcriptional regulator